MQILPPDFDKLVAAAVRVFWASRASGTASQGGSRGKVISGKNLDGFIGVVQAIAQHCGLPGTSVHTTGRTMLTLPGYFRPVKNWDVVIVHQHRLLAALELKSQVGSFGNNFNNRAEEAIGNATDLWAAHMHGFYHPRNHAGQPAPLADDPRPPFLGYLMLLQDCPQSTRSVRTRSPHFNVDDDLINTSYAARYRVLCERLMERGLYSAASLMLTSPTSSPKALEAWRSLSPATDVRNLFAELAARLLAATQA